MRNGDMCVHMGKYKQDDAFEYMRMHTDACGNIFSPILCVAGHDCKVLCNDLHCCAVLYCAYCASSARCAVRAMRAVRAVHAVQSIGN